MRHPKRIEAFFGRRKRGALERHLMILLVAIGAVSPFTDARTLAEHPTTISSGTLPSLARGAKVLAFGDSLTFGVGGSGTTYPQRLSQLIGHEVINAGIPGDTSGQGLERLASVLEEVKPALVILCLGVNDYLRRLPPDALRVNLQAMVDEITRAGIPAVILAIPPPRGGAVAPWFALLAQERLVLVDEHAMADVLRQSALKADLVHPNSDGYRTVAEALARSLTESGALTQAR